MRVMILTAVQIEALAVARALGLARSGKTSWANGEKSQLPISMRMIGMGAVQLPTIEPGGVRCVVMAGLAGGLDPSLRIGDLVIDAQSTQPAHFEALRGQIFTSKTLVATPAEKSACREKSGAVAVDMENQIAREWAAKIEVPFLGIRAISDRADESIDPSFVNAIDEFGRVNPVRLAAGLLVRPVRVKSLVRLGRHAKLAAGRLGKAVAEVVATIDRSA